MKSRGIRIADIEDGILGPTLPDLLKEIVNGESYYWSILFVDGVLKGDQDYAISDFEERINQSKNGYFIEWKELVSFSDPFFQMYEALVLGNKDYSVLSCLSRYDDEDDMYAACDFVIDLIDCAYWEVYSKDQKFLDRLQKKFRDVKVLE